MKKKKVLIILAVIVALAIPLSVYAATSDTPAAKSVRGFFGIDTSKLTDQQKSDIKDYSQKMADLQKQFINKMVENGTMTKEQGDAAISRIDAAQKNGTLNGLMKGMGMFGFEGNGGKGFDGLGKLDTSKLTDQQKADLAVTYKKMADQQKQFVDKLVADGVMTKNQGDAASKKIDAMEKNLETNGLPKGIGGFGAIGVFAFKGVDTSKLTDQQKADIKAFSQNMADLQKELVNKLVADGVMTKEQGDSAVSRIDTMQKNFDTNGFSKGMDMRKGHFGGRGMKGSPNTNTNTVPES